MARRKGGGRAARAQKRKSAALEAAEFEKQFQFFHLFPQLPPELRLKIWGFGRPKARIVRVFKPTHKVDEQIRFPPSIPGLLHACSESRHEALKWYDLSFGIGANEDEFIYFDHSRDFAFHQPCPRTTRSYCGLNGPSNHDVKHRLTFHTSKRIAIEADTTRWPVATLVRLMFASTAVEEMIYIKNNFSNDPSLTFGSVANLEDFREWRGAELNEQSLAIHLPQVRRYISMPECLNKLKKVTALEPRRKVKMV